MQIIETYQYLIALAIMKVLLAYLCHYQDRNDYFISLLPVGLVSIAACLKKAGHDVTLANFSKMGYRKALQQILEIKPDVAGLSLFTHNRIDSLRLATELKKLLSDTMVILGGPHATFLAEEIINRHPEIDYIIQGEAENAFNELLEKIQSRKKPSNKIIPANIIKNIDNLPCPGEFSGTLIDIEPEEQFSYIITSRGCPQRCVFCSSPRFWQRRVRYRTPESIVKEMKYLHDKYRIIYFSIRDDNFSLNKKRVLKFTQQLKNSGLYIMWNCQARVDTIDEEMLIAMKQAGLEHIQYGVESGSERVLKLYDKYSTIEKIERAAAITRRVGVYLSIYLMAGMEGEQQADINKTKALIRRILPRDGIVSPVAFYPGTSLYEQAKKKERIGNDFWFQNRKSGVFLRNDRQVQQWMNELLMELDRVKKKARYGEKDFKLHRQVTDEDCWVTDILEGDYYFNKNRYQDAGKCYRRVIDKFPHNPWGPLKMDALPPGIRTRTGNMRLTVAKK